MTWSVSLTQFVLSTHLPEEVMRERLHNVHRETLKNSHCVSAANFEAIHPRDLEFLFQAYDQRFFEGLCSPALAGRRLTFRLSTRMTRAGGKTTRFTAPNGAERFEIAIAIGTLFDGFDGMDRSVTVCGLECTNRLDALQRIFEHEMVHLIEQLCWRESDCSAGRFRSIAARFFGHRAHTHNLVTRRERAAQVGIQPGTLVSFVFEGQALTGRVNRITKRATVLVEHSEGSLFSDGRRYRIYYVPIAGLRVLQG